MTTRILSNNKHNRFHLHYLFDVVKLFLDSFISISFRSIAASSLSRTLSGFVASSSYSLPTGRFVSFEFKNFSSTRRKKKMVGATNQLVCRVTGRVPAFNRNDHPIRMAFHDSPASPSSARELGMTPALPNPSKFLISPRALAWFVVGGGERGLG